MDTSSKPETAANDDNQLVKQALKIQELVKNVRADAGLGPIIKTKRSLSTATDQQDTKEDIDRLKKQKTEQDKVEAEAAATRAFLIEKKTSLFFSRLKSYSPRFNYRKRPFTPLDCAKHGWRDTHLVGKADSKTCILECDECRGKMFVISFDPNSNNPKVKEVTNIYKEGLITCHAENCQWRNGPDEEVRYIFPIETLEDGMNRFKEKARMFIKSQQEYKTEIDNNPLQSTEEGYSIPPLQHPLDESTLSKIHALATHFYQQQQQHETQDKDTLAIEIIYSAHVLSLFGWQLLDPSVPGIECELCGSRKGFYQFRDGKKLDVVEEHRDYCPWVNSETADAYSPKVSSLIQNRTISGYEWMVDTISIEYNLYMRKKYLSLSSRNATDDEHYQLKQKMRQANELLQLWNSDSSKKEQ